MMIMSLNPNPKNRPSPLMAQWKSVYRVTMVVSWYDDPITVIVQSLKAAEWMAERVISYERYSEKRRQQYFSNPAESD
jgi:hypothetical protein